MRYNRYSTHSVHQISVHLVWITKYRYSVLKGEIQLRTRQLIQQICDTNDIKILKGVVSKDHIHIHISYPPKLSISEIVRKIKGRSARKLLQEFPELKKNYWGGHLWGIGYGGWSTGNITNEMIQEYLEHHRDQPNHTNDTFIIE
jgi:putative transposase